MFKVINEKAGQLLKKPYLRVTLMCAALAVLTFIVFARGVHNGFVNFDDDTYITENAHVKAGLSWNGVKWAFTTTYANFWHPLTWLSHMADCELFGMNAGMHHMSALFFHLASTLLLFLFFLRTTKKAWPSFFVALFFGIHPLHVESVAWASERKDVLSTFFWMLTMLCYSWYAEKPSFKRYLYVFLSFSLGIMAKPMLVTLPFVLLVLDWWPLRRLTGKNVKDLVIEKSPLILISLGASILAYMAQESGGAIGSIEKFSILMRMSGSILTYAGYLVKTILPFHLIVPYPHPGMQPLWQVQGAFLALACITYLTVRYADKLPFLLAGWLWYIGTLVPVIGLVQLGSHVMADRYTYVPLIGIFIMAAWGANELWARWPATRLGVTIFAAAVSVFLMTAAFIQVGYWKSPSSLFEHTLSVNYDNVTAHNNLGSALLGKGKKLESELHFAEAMKLNPENSKVQFNLGFSLARQGKDDEALVYYSKALKLEPYLFEANRGVGDILYKHANYKRASDFYKRALEVKPHDLEVNTGMGNALINGGNAGGAIPYYRTAVQLDPGGVTYYNLGYAYLTMGDIDRAREVLAKSLSFAPDNAMAHNNLANALARSGNDQEAVEHYHEALRINPGFAEAHCNLGIVLKRSGRIDEAREEFEKTLKINPGFKQAAKQLKELEAAAAKEQTPL